MKKKLEGKSRPPRGGEGFQRVKRSPTTNSNRPKGAVKNYPTVPGVDTLSLLQLLHKHKFPFTLEALLAKLRLRRNQNQLLSRLLNTLREKGFVVRLKDGRWAASASEGPELEGIFSTQRSGATFVILDQKKSGEPRSDIFIPPNSRNGAWHGDRVSVALNPFARQGKSPEGQVVRVIERSLKEVVVGFSGERQGDLYICSAVDYRLDVDFAVDASSLEVAPQHGDLILITPGPQLKRRLFSGTAIKVLGSERDVYTQEELVKHTYKIPLGFSEEVLEEGRALDVAFAELARGYAQDVVKPRPDISKTSTSVRQDLRGVDFVTIDGEDAKDFDDAICAYKQGDGWELWVAIADVGHFVALDSLIDKEAQDRANSYYFPSSVSPMLPESLSNGVCSLQPNVERMVMATKISFDEKGAVRNAVFFPGIIRSQARITYEQARAALEDGDGAKFPPHIQASLENANALAKILRTVRMERGSLEFDLPEAQFLIDQTTGELKDITRRDRYASHSLIEECMLAANEAVARYLTEKGARFLYRAHPKPDQERLEKLFRVLATTHLAERLPKNPDAGALRSLIVEAENTPCSFLINRMILRSMMQAYYSPELEEHFSLASPCYCHFTSPIRRYADLATHRALKSVLGDEGGVELPPQRLQKIADQCNTRERVAQDAEREIAKRLGCLFLYGREGETFQAIIISVTDFGFFVELVSAPIEGIVRLTSLKNDWFEYDQDRQELLGARTGTRFVLGQPIEVVLTSVSLTHIDVEFTVEEKGGVGGSEKKPGRKGVRRRPRGRGPINKGKKAKP